MNLLQVTEENEPLVPFHWVEATVNVTIKEIPEEAVDKSGSIRFVNITAEEFIVPEADVSLKLYYNLIDKFMSETV